MQTGAQHIQAVLARMVATGADARSIADAACSIWVGMSSALSPIIGHRGMIALYRRSLHLTQEAHPGLAAAYAAPEELEDFTAGLREALANQSSANAASANSALLTTFYDLLSNLIGAALTARLLRSILSNPSIEPAEQDPTS